MGADLLLASVAVRHGKKYEGVTLDDRKAWMLNMAKTMEITKEDVWAICEHSTGDEPPETLKERRELVLNTINDFFNCLYYRDVTWTGVSIWQIIISGGLSWGDTPTESYRTIENFTYLPRRLLKHAGFYGG